MKPKFITLLLATVAAAQDLPVIKVTTRLVEINVVARDQHGPIAGLTKDDFKIYDQDRLQQVALFQANAAPAKPDNAPPPAASTPPGVFTNQSAPAAGPATVILLDGAMTSAMDQASAKAQILKFLQQVQPPDRVAIFLMNGKLQLVQDFTGDSAMLVHALQVQQWGAGLQRNPQKPDAAFVNGRAIPKVELAALVKGVSATFISNNVTPLGAGIKQECIQLVALARHLARVSGRKNLIWVTGGFPLVKWSAEPEVFTDEVSQANHAFSDANVAVYPLDARGLVGMSQDMTVSDASFQPATGAATPAIPMGGKGSPDTRAPGSEGKDMMNYVAHFTGGQAFTDNNDLGVPMRKVTQDAEVSYTLGFYPDSATLDSKRHTVKVEVDRKVADLRYRQGYTASPEPPETKIPEKAEITEAIWSPLDATGITISARANKVNRPQPGMLQLAISVSGTDVILQPNDKGWIGTLAVVYDERAADGRDLGRISDTLNMQFDEEHRQKLLTDGIAFDKLVRPSAQASQIRIVIYDRNSGRVGSLAVKL